MQRTDELSLRQSQIARELKVVPMEVMRIATAVGIRRGRPLSLSDGASIIVARHLKEMGFTFSVATNLVAEARDIVRFLCADQKRKGWIILVDCGGCAFRLHAISDRHLVAILERFPAAPIIPLHAMVQGALERLNTPKAQRNRSHA
ncbi:hypothetical protein [Martelella sp. FOR1707]